MSSEQNPRKKAIESARRDKAKGIKLEELAEERNRIEGRSWA